MLKRAPSLTEQTKSHLKDRILNDEFDNGRIPSETDLANELGVSRTTVRDALSRLENEGVVYRKQGAGTFINEAGLQIKSRLDEIWSYEEMIAAHGHEPSTQILDISKQPASAEIATDLNVGVDEELLVVRKLFLADNQPVILAHNYVPTKYITQTYKPEDLVIPIYEFMWGFGRQLFSYYLAEIVPSLASNELALTFQIQPQTPLIALHEIGYNDDNNPILKSTSCFRDDLLRFRLIRRQSA